MTDELISDSARVEAERERLHEAVRRFTLAGEEKTPEELQSIVAWAFEWNLKNADREVRKHGAKYWAVLDKISSGIERSSAAWEKTTTNKWWED